MGPHSENPHADPDGWIRNRLHRRGGNGTARFITFSCVDRLPLFHRPETCDAFERCLYQTMDQAGILLLAWVLMPEHVHLLLDPGVLAKGWSRVQQRLKARFAFETLATWRRERPEAVERLIRPDGSTRFWQAGGCFDREVQDPWKVRRATRYLHANPVRRGLVERAGDWRWSSAWDGDVAWDPRNG